MSDEKMRTGVIVRREAFDQTGRWLVLDEPEPGVSSVRLKIADVTGYTVWRYGEASGQTSVRTEVYMRGGARIDICGNHGEALDEAIFDLRGV